MSDRVINHSADREDVSALVDGELDGPAAAAVCAAWGGDAAIRRDWHTWQLIGDVLRSEDLAAEARHDAQFLAAVRERLAGEPVVLAPAPLSAPVRRLSATRWAVPSAVAAGFVLVVGVVSLVQPGAPTAPSSPPLARLDTRPGAAPVAAISPALTAAEPQTAVVADGKLIRDARLDRYLAAHKQFAGTSALGVPSTFLRSATVDAAVVGR